MIKACVLGSGSRGNCTVVAVDNNLILLDAGLNFKQTGIRMYDTPFALENVEKVFITHDHGDHVAAVPTMEKRLQYPPTVYSEKNNNMEDGKIVYLNRNKEGASVTGFRLDHDEPCLGYTVKDTDGNKLVYVTDTGSIPCDSLIHMLDPSILIVESNHDVGMLNDSPYNDELQDRVFETHLENLQAGELISVLNNPKLRHIALFHLSENANSPELAEYEAGVGLGDKNKAAVTITTTSQKHPSRMMVVI